MMPRAHTGLRKGPNMYALNLLVVIAKPKTDRLFTCLNALSKNGKNFRKLDSHATGAARMGRALIGFLLGKSTKKDSTIQI